MDVQLIHIIFMTFQKCPSVVSLLQVTHKNASLLEGRGRDGVRNLKKGDMKEKKGSATLKKIISGIFTSVAAKLPFLHHSLVLKMAQ